MGSVRNCSVSFDAFTASIVFASLNLVSAVTAVSSNGLILLAFYQIRSLRSISNFFIASLAVSDLLVGLVLNPVYVVIYLTGVSFDFTRVWPVRLAEHWLWIQTVITSTFNLTAISLDRFIAVTTPFRYTETVTPRRCIYGAVFIWTFSILFASVRFLIHDPQYLPMLWITITIFMVLLPLIIICYCYFHIFGAARRQQRQVAALSSVNAAYKRTILKNKKAAWTIGIIIGLFVLMWSPSLVLSLVSLAMTDTCTRRRVAIGWYISAFVSFLSSCCNPWVYAARSREFRMAVKRVLRPQRIHSSDQAATSLESFPSARMGAISL